MNAGKGLGDGKLAARWLVERPGAKRRTAKGAEAPARRLRET